MQSKNDILLLHEDIILMIFSNSNLEIQDIFVISLVCQSWRDLSQKNPIWKQLFINQFAHDPTIFFGPSFFKEQYRKLLITTQELHSHKRVCQGLIEAIKTKNILLMYLSLTNHSDNNSDRVIENNQEPVPELISLCAQLPQSLSSKLMEGNFLNSTMKSKEDCGTVALFTEIIEFWGDDALKSLMQEKINGKNFLYYALQDSNLTLLPIIQKFLGADFKKLLLAKDDFGNDILSQIILVHHQSVLDFVNATLNLLKEYDCLDIAHNLYISNKSTELADLNLYIDDSEGLDNLFNNHGIERPENSWCNLM